jgi:hypothetical protein
MTAYGNWSRGGGFVGGVFDGACVWLVPSTATSVVRINISDGNMTFYSTFPQGFNATGNYSFQGGTFDGRSVWLAPQNATAVVLIDVSSGSMKALHSWPVGISQGDRMFQGAMFDGDAVWLVPKDATAVVRVDVRSERMTAFDTWPSGTSSTYLRIGNGSFVSGVFDGSSLWLVPWCSRAILRISGVGGASPTASSTTSTTRASLCTSPSASPRSASGYPTVSPV